MRDFDWQIIVTLHRTSSITKTAERLFISQPALTKRIKGIEDELGITLLIRNYQGSFFTPEGERIARKAERVVAAIQETKDEASAHNRGEKGSIRLGFPYAFIRHVLPAILSEFAGRYPNVDIDILTLPSQELVKCAEDGSIDVCLARYGAEESFLERKLFSEDQAYVVYNKPFELAELKDMPFIEFAKNPGTTSALRRWWNERFTTSPNVRFKVTTSDACISMIQHGLGCGFILDSRYFGLTDNLYSLPLEYLDGTKLTRKTWLFYRKEVLANPVAVNFIRLIEEQEYEKL